MPDVMRFDVPRRTVAENRARASPPPVFFFFSKRWIRLLLPCENIRLLDHRREREGDWTKEKNVGKDWWRRYNRISIQWHLL